MNSPKILGHGKMKLGDNVQFGENVTINVDKYLEIGDRSIIGDFFSIEGRWIKIGREFWSGRFCGIGGGSCHEKLSQLTWGDFGHLGDFSFINTAREVSIGDEVGLGQETKVYTHGVYEDFLKGFPVEFGPVRLEDRVWCPKAIIMPNVTIGHDTVVGAGTIVTKNLPAGCLAVGIPVKVIRENWFPKVYTKEEKEEKIRNFVSHFKTNILNTEAEIVVLESKIEINGTSFDLDLRRIVGPATYITEKLKNELRRFGTRFKYYNKDGVYVPW